MCVCVILLYHIQLPSLHKSIQHIQPPCIKGMLFSGGDCLARLMCIESRASPMFRLPPLLYLQGPEKHHGSAMMVRHLSPQSYVIHM